MNFDYHFIARLIRTQAWPETSFPLPRFQCHRGYHVEGLKENTIDSFKVAATKGFEMVELDVQLTKDKIPIVFHDKDLASLNNINIKIKDLDLVKLRSYLHVNTLEEVFKAKDLPKYFNIELKTSEIGNESLERKVCHVVEKYQKQSHVLFSSFNPFSLWKVSQYLPAVPRALLVTQKDESENHFLLKTMMLAPMISIHLLHLDQDMLNEQELNFWKKKGIPISAWTVNEKPQAEKLLRWGCISIITDSILF